MRDNSYRERVDGISIADQQLFESFSVEWGREERKLFDSSVSYHIGEPYMTVNRTPRNNSENDDRFRRV